MNADNVLTVWLDGEDLGELQQLRNGRMRLRMSSGAVDRYGAGSAALSLSVRISTKRVEGLVLDRFLQGLLPEGAVRAALERHHRISPGDTFGMLRAIGLECAGAVQFTPQGQVPGEGSLRELTTEEVDRVVQDLPTLQPPEGVTVGASLSGVQSKVLLTRTETGWAWPVDGAMSTHIIKPEPVSDIVVPHLVEHEVWAMRLAQAVGLPAAGVELADFGDRRAIVVERYDRNGGRRTHQEDFTQALSILTAEKYEPASSDPPRLRQIAERAGAEALDPAAFRLDLLRQVAFNVIIGNGDAHSKNYSLVLRADGTVSLAPLYDAAPVFLVNSRITPSGHALDGQSNLKYIRAHHLLRAAVDWGVDPDDAAETVGELARAVAETTEQVPALPEVGEIPAKVRDRAAGFAEASRGAA